MANLLKTFGGLAGVIPAGVGGWVGLGISLQVIATRAAIILGTIGTPDITAEQTQALADALQKDLEKIFSGIATGGVAGLHPLSGVLNTTKGIFGDLSALLKSPPAGCSVRG
ncbi:MAG: hypothetical protein JKY56_13650 [Kofleriaceae bacterium]|nr:hypothetical protein [Kofleriaceae bacterium]